MSWKKMQRISWTEKRTNDWVRMDIGIEKEETLQQTVPRAKLKFFGQWTCHAIRRIGKGNDASIWRGKEKQGRPRKKWMDEIHEVTRMNLAELRDATADRRKWRGLIMTVARVQGTDSTR